jgi:hypothetical protein
VSLVGFAVFGKTIVQQETAIFTLFGCGAAALGEVIFNIAGGGVWPRSFGWAIFGMLVGTSDGFAQRMPAKIRYGILGGLLGGLVGGSTYEALVSLMRHAENRAAALAWGSAIGLIILGACIGALIGLVESLLRRAWLFFFLGRLEGQTRTLDSRQRTTLGRSSKCSIVIPEDDTIAALHAEIRLKGSDFVLRACEGPVTISREGKEEAVTETVLQRGDRIRLGKSGMAFRCEEAKKT